MSVHIRFVGGLGNQMFQYAFLYSLLRKSKEKIFGCFFHTKDETPKQYALGCFPLSLRIIVADENDGGIHIKMMKAIRLIYRVCRKFFIVLGGKEKTINSIFQKIGFVINLRAYDYTPVSSKNVKHIEGFYQNYRYFDEFANEIRKEFTVKVAPSKKNARLICELEKCESVCVHVRRGDYIESHWANNWAICDYDYYRQGMAEIKRYVKNPVFYVFSNTHDDIKWVKKNYDLGDVKYVDLNNSDFDDLRLMYTCKHFIISNSTYSWWAQYLSNSSNKIVVAPSVWVKGDAGVQSKNLYMPNWHIIEV